MKKKTNKILIAGITLFFLGYIIIAIVHFSKWESTNEEQNNGKWRFYRNSGSLDLVAPDITIETFTVESDSMVTEFTEQ